MFINNYSLIKNKQSLILCCGVFMNVINEHDVLLNADTVVVSIAQL